MHLNSRQHMPKSKVIFTVGKTTVRHTQKLAYTYTYMKK